MKDIFPDRYSGFTIIELMVTLVVMAILVTMAAPSFQNFVANQRVKTDTNDLMVSMLFARSEAIKRNEDVTVSAVDNNWADGWLVTDGGGNTLRSQGPLANTLVNSGGTGSVAFNRSGRLSGGGIVTFSLCDDKDKATKRVLTISLTGSARVDLDGACGS